MTVNPSGWRPSAPSNEQGEAETVTGNRALMLEEPLLFEIGSPDQTGVDFTPLPLAGGAGGGPTPNPSREREGKSRIGGLERSRPIDLPGLSEPEAVRHYT